MENPKINPYEDLYSETSSFSYHLPFPKKKTSPSLNTSTSDSVKSSSTLRFPQFRRGDKTEIFFLVILIVILESVITIMAVILFFCLIIDRFYIKNGKEKTCIKTICPINCNNSFTHLSLSKPNLIISRTLTDIEIRKTGPKQPNII